MEIRKSGGDNKHMLNCRLVELNQCSFSTRVVELYFNGWVNLWYTTSHQNKYHPTEQINLKYRNIDQKIQNGSRTSSLH